MFQNATEFKEICFLVLLITKYFYHLRSFKNIFNFIFFKITTNNDKIFGPKIYLQDKYRRNFWR